MTIEQCTDCECRWNESGRCGLPATIFSNVGVNEHKRTFHFNHHDGTLICADKEREGIDGLF